MTKLKQAGAFLADIILPNRCPCCGRFIRWDGLLCEKCRDELPEYPGGIGEPPEGCSGAVSAYIYKGAAKQGVLALKDGRGRNMAVFASAVLAERLEGCGAEIITSVPMSRRQRAERGCDHAREIAAALSERMGIPCDHTLLHRRDTEVRQHDLNASERRDFAGKVYMLPRHPGDIRGRRILLADDILTTGSTLSACAGLLLSLGAAEVMAVTICRTLPEEEENSSK